MSILSCRKRGIVTELMSIAGILGVLLSWVFHCGFPFHGRSLSIDMRGESHRTCVRLEFEIDLTFEPLFPPPSPVVPCTGICQLVSITFSPSLSTIALPIFSHYWLSHPSAAPHRFRFPQLYLGRDTEASVCQCLFLHFLTMTNGEHLSCGFPLALLGLDLSLQ